ncbi:hypothetical protein ACFVJH_30215 [Streptomyces decoyicus]|uniref:hypothetical protein n=1 Tax=Streptomyces decoyicus TaxID=249567 RepID=UPI00362801AB
MFSTTALAQPIFSGPASRRSFQWLCLLGRRSPRGAWTSRRTRTAQVGKTITVTAQGGDDSAGYLHQLCLEGKGFGEGRHQENCSAAVEGDARVTAHGTSARRGNLQFRAVVHGLTSPHDQNPVRLHASDVVTVHVR